MRGSPRRGQQSCEALLPADMKQGLLSGGIEWRESRSGCLTWRRVSPSPAGTSRMGRRGADKEGEGCATGGRLTQPEAPCHRRTAPSAVPEPHPGLEVHKQNALPVLLRHV